MCDSRKGSLAYHGKGDKQIWYSFLVQWKTEVAYIKTPDEVADNLEKMLMAVRKFIRPIACHQQDGKGDSCFRHWIVPTVNKTKRLINVLLNGLMNL
jgi:hypothetical protein